MRKLIFPLLLIACIPLGRPGGEASSAESAHYRVFSETSQSQAEEVSRRMEACLRLYNDIFHFDLAALPSKMRVRVHRDAASFNAYLTRSSRRPARTSSSSPTPTPRSRSSCASPARRRPSPPRSSTRAASSS